MNGSTSYRAFVLQALRTGPLEIAERISEHKNLINEAQKDMEYRAFRVVLLWALGLSAFLALLVGLLLENIYAGVGVVVVLLVVSLAFTRIKAVRNKLLSSKRYQAQQVQIQRSTQAIDELRNNARAYQQRLEINDGPGFLATYTDILLSEYYPSFFSLDDRERFVRLSEHGRGGEIDVFEYARLLFELKANGIEAYMDAGGLLEQVAPQSKYSAAVAYARLIAFNNARVTEDDIRFAALVGFNAWLMYQAQGRPANWQNYEHLEWDLVKLVLEHAFRKNTLGLAKAAAEYQELERKFGKNVRK